MMRLFLLIYISSIVYIYAQQKITVPVRVEGRPFNVTFPPDLVNAIDVAKELCTRNAEAFDLASIGITACVEPLQEYFQQVINRYNSQLSLKISVNVQGNDFNIIYRPDRISAKTMATRLCSENSQVLGILEETLPDCVNPVNEYLLRAEKQFIAQRTVGFPVTINSKKYDLEFRTDLVSAVDAATELCQSQAEFIGLTSETMNQCVDPTSDYIQNVLNRWLQSRAIKIPMIVNNIEFSIEIQPDLESAIDAARQICSLGEKINITTNQIPACVDDIVRNIRQAYTVSQSKEISSIISESTPNHESSGGNSSGSDEGSDKGSDKDTDSMTVHSGEEL